LREEFFNHCSQVLLVNFILAAQNKVLISQEGGIDALIQAMTTHRFCGAAAF
jgi:hypothetical protein